jgi:hypothetical protein
MTWCSSAARHRIFQYLILQRLPTEIRIILAEDRDSTLATLAARADQLWTHSTQQPRDAAVNTAVDVAEDVAAKAAPFCGRGGGGAPPASMAAAANSNQNAPSKLARQSSGLCRFHWQFGDKACSCRLPCSWQAN